MVLIPRSANLLHGEMLKIASSSMERSSRWWGGFSAFSVRARNSLPVSPPSDVVPWQAIAPPVESTGLTESDPEAPLVSVIIPNFNLGAYLPSTLSSVAASGYPNIEIIVCDDASTDPLTIELLGRLEQDFKNRSLTIVHARYNRGLAGARNLAIRKAQGQVHPDPGCGRSDFAGIHCESCGGIGKKSRLLDCRSADGVLPGRAK